jgi:hypothetical protein
VANQATRCLLAVSLCYANETSRQFRDSGQVPKTTLNTLPASLNNPISINITTQEKPILKPHSCAIGPSGLPRIA